MEKFSYSKLSTYEQCKYKYKLRYIDKHFIYSGNIATEFGTAVHKIEEIIAKKLQNNEKIDYVKLKNQFLIENIKIRHKYPEQYLEKDKSGYNYEEKQNFYLKNSITFLENYLKNHPNIIILDVEAEFLIQFDETRWFTGAIDRIMYDTSTKKYIIQDIKSWGVLAEQRDLKSPLQFAIYAFYVKSRYKCEVEDMIFEYCLPLCNTTQRVISTNILKDGEKTVNKIFEGIEDANFKPTITALCHWCPHNPLNNLDLLDSNLNAICPYGSTWQKSGDDVKKTIIKWTDSTSEFSDKQLYKEQIINYIK